MKKNTALGDAISAIQKENEKLKNLEKLFEKAVKSEFGYDVKVLHKIVEKYKETEHKNTSISLVNQAITGPHSNT